MQPNSKPFCVSSNNFLRNLQVLESKDSKTTIEFIFLMNNVFDILNSRSNFGKFAKRAITLKSFCEIEGYLMDGIETLRFFKDTAGAHIIRDPRKTFVHGFTIIIKISKMLSERTEAPFSISLLSRSKRNVFLENQKSLCLEQ